MIPLIGLWNVTEFTSYGLEGIWLRLNIGSHANFPDLDEYDENGFDFTTEWQKNLTDDRRIDTVSSVIAHDVATSQIKTTALDYGKTPLTRAEWCYWLTMGLWCDSNEPARLAVAQTLSIPQLLDIGVRGLDLRIGRYGTHLRMGHGPFMSELTPRHAFQLIKNWLQKHPTEFLIVNVQQEPSHMDKVPFMNQEFSDNNKEQVYNLIAGLPLQKFGPNVTVGEVRGKVIFTTDSGENSLQKHLTAKQWEKLQPFEFKECHTIGGYANSDQKEVVKDVLIKQMKSKDLCPPGSIIVAHDETTFKASSIVQFNNHFSESIKDRDARVNGENGLDIIRDAEEAGGSLRGEAIKVDFVGPNKQEVIKESIMANFETKPETARNLRR